MIDDEPEHVVIPAERSAPPFGLPVPSRWHPMGRTPWIPLVLGAWLFLSIFMWPHAPASFDNTWLIGVLVSGFGALTFYVPWLRWVNALLAAWLCISTLVIGDVVGVTVWNNVIVAIAVGAASLVALPPSDLHHHLD